MVKSHIQTNIVDIDTTQYHIIHNVFDSNESTHFLFTIKHYVILFLSLSFFWFFFKFILSHYHHHHVKTRKKWWWSHSNDNNFFLAIHWQSFVCVCVCVHFVHIIRSPSSEQWWIFKFFFCKFFFISFHSIFQNLFTFIIMLTIIIVMSSFFCSFHFFI